jgi:hypothetical protein
MKSMKLILAFFAMVIFASGINAQADPAAAKKGGKSTTAQGLPPELRDDAPSALPKKKKVAKVAPSQAQGADMQQGTTGDKGAKPDPRPAPRTEGNPAPRPTNEKPKAKKTTAPAEKQ